MSRIGKRPIPIDSKVKVHVDGRKIKVEGPLGQLDALMPDGVPVRVEGGEVFVDAPEPTRDNRGYRGLVRALIANMVEGVTKGYERTVEISGVGYKAELSGSMLSCSLGFTHLVRVEVPAGVEVTLDKSQTRVTVKGADRQAVGQVAAQVRNAKPSEPYKGKGAKYAEETIRRKVGKTGVK